MYYMQNNKTGDYTKLKSITLESAIKEGMNILNISNRLQANQLFKITQRVIKK